MSNDSVRLMHYDHRWRQEFEQTRSSNLVVLRRLDYFGPAHWQHRHFRPDRPAHHRCNRHCGERSGTRRTPTQTTTKVSQKLPTGSRV